MSVSGRLRGTRKRLRLTGKTLFSSLAGSQNYTERKAPAGRKRVTSNMREITQFISNNYRGHMYMCVSLNNNNMRNVSGTVSVACALQSVAFWV